MNSTGFQGILSSSHAAFLQKSTDFGSCLSCLQPLMIKYNFYFILVFLKAVMLYASQLSPFWKLYSFLSGIKRSSCSEWDALWAGSARVQETLQDYLKLHHQKQRFQTWKHSKAHSGLTSSKKPQASLPDSICHKIFSRTSLLISQLKSMKHFFLKKVKNTNH